MPSLASTNHVGANAGRLDGWFHSVDDTVSPLTIVTAGSPGSGRNAVITALHVTPWSTFMSPG